MQMTLYVKKLSWRSSMKTVIEAVFVGDSHGTAIQVAGERNDIVFQCPITAASAMYAGSKLVDDGVGNIIFEVQPYRLDEARIGVERVKHRAHKASQLGTRFRQAFDSQLPVYSTIGMTARNFVLGIVSAAAANGQDAANISTKIAKAAAEDFFSSHKEFYEFIVARAPKVVAFYGPTRFEANMRHIWMAYDNVVRDTLTGLGVELIDLRAEFGDEQLQLRPEFGREPIDDGVHGNDAWGLRILEVIQQHMAETSPVFQQSDV
jgi:hypothetical protein